MLNRGDIMTYDGRSVADGIAHCTNGTVLTLFAVLLLSFSPIAKVLRQKFPN